MKKIIGLTTAALMGASMFAAPALAQSDAITGADEQLQMQPDTNAGTTAGDLPGAFDGDSVGSDIGDTDTLGDQAESLDIDTMGTDAGTTASISGEASFDGALAAIESNSANTAALDTMTDVGNVEVIRIGELEGADMSAVDAATSEHQADISQLQTSLNGNTAISDALEAENVASSDVVATEMAADGELRVYVR